MTGPDPRPLPPLPEGWSVIRVRGEWAAFLTLDDPMLPTDNSVTWNPARGVASIDLYTSGPPERGLAQVQEIPAVLAHLKARAEGEING